MRDLSSRLFRFKYCCSVSGRVRYINRRRIEVLGLLLRTAVRCIRRGRLERRKSYSDWLREEWPEAIPRMTPVRPQISLLLMSLRVSCGQFAVTDEVDGLRSHIRGSHRSRRIQWLRLMRKGQSWTRQPIGHNHRARPSRSSYGTGTRGSVRELSRWQILSNMTYCVLR